MSSLFLEVPAGRAWFGTLLPSLVVLAGYGGWCSLAELPGSADVVRLRADAHALEASCPTPAMIEQLRARLTTLKADQAAATTSFDVVRQQAERISAGAHSTIERMDLLILITAVFERHHLVVASDRAIETSARPKLASALDDGLKELASVLRQVVLPSGAGPVSYAPIVIPGLDEAINPEELLGALRSSRGSGSGGLPPLQMREVTAWGSYHDFVAALEAIQYQCPDLFVIAIGMQPDQQGQPGRHGWTVLLSIHPSPWTAAPSGPPATPQPRPESEPQPQPRQRSDGNPLLVAE